MPHVTDPDAAHTQTAGAFGRGWIPASRDIGLPGDEIESAHPQPLPQAGGEFAGLPLLAPHNAFSPQRIAQFLAHLSLEGNVRAAALAAGVSAQTAYVRRRRDAAFAGLWDAALIVAREAAEQVLATRALHGTTETIWFRGEAVGERRRFDSRLLLAHLARLDARAARASAAVCQTVATFDETLAALAQGHAPATATAWPDPARDAFVAERVTEARHAFTHESPEPEDTRDDHAWDLWEAALGQAEAEALTAALTEWDDEVAAREALLDAALGGEGEPLEYKAEAAHQPPFVSGTEKIPFVPAEVETRQPPAQTPLDSVNPVNPFPPRAAGCRLASAPQSRLARRRTKGEHTMRRATLIAALAATALSAPAFAKPVTLTATLTGAAETGGGDADGAGGFKAEADDDTGDFCFTLWAEKIAPATMAHVHEGAAGADGKPVGTIEVTGKDSDACIALEPALIKKILAAPGDYYVNVHNTDFPKGALRGQLAKN
ncbi:CHRD domain-containing protein [Novosphingobium sp. MMS21-SN21R]|uniref:CHRD domain-containing protein n=1 Tax=Novosphingobium sp. MMS21-SN21R TaxID=2969298 RepID=UPI00288393C9|nr:CHRD domain-containing protein [Novosphingobium sp. MMS21-SN21R]MDT0508667.1 CHRD domain-containing protein [Novosphingobium sp. MMS21-SN21R]